MSRGLLTKLDIQPGIKSFEWLTNTADPTLVISSRLFIFEVVRNHAILCISYHFDDFMKEDLKLVGMRAEDGQVEDRVGWSQVIHNILVILSQFRHSL